jgi:hypothetical protein
MSQIDPSDLLDSILDGVLATGTATTDATDATDAFSMLDSINLSDSATAMRIDTSSIIQLGDGEVDPRLKLLSHSSRSLLHKCPRKYQLYRLASEQQATSDIAEQEQSVTFAYGHAVGIGVQAALEGKSEDACLIDAFLGWDADLLLETPRQNKSFWLAVHAVRKFVAMRSANFLADYELVYWNGKPAVELSFVIKLPNGYTYRGFLDAALMHKTTGAVIVLENKTSSGKAISAQYKNSGQALGYSVILDILFPELSSYQVLYMVYETKTMEYVQLPFTKSLLQRALWLQELLIDTQLIDLYDTYGTYPMHGEACYDFFRDCEYLSLCTLSTANLTTPLTENVVANIAVNEAKYDFEVDFIDLVSGQISKGE